MSRIRGFCRSHPILIAAVAFVVYLIFSFGYFGFGQGIVREISARLIIAGIMFFLMALVAGWKVIKPSAQGLGFALRKSALLLAITIASSVPVYIALFTGQIEIISNWFPILLGVFLLCFSIGLFEESLFRGIIFNACLAKLGSNRNGVVFAAIISSLIFGFAHVYFYFIFGGITSITTLAQALMKMLQTAMIGFLLCALYLKTRNIWPIALVHALFDFFPTLPTFLQGAQSPPADYVSSSPEVSAGIIAVYLILIIVNIPLVVIGWRIFSRMSIPNKGFFVDSWNPSNKAEPSQGEAYVSGTDEHEPPYLE